MSEKKQRSWKKICGITAVAIIGVLVVVRIILTPVAVAMVNKQLPKALRATGEIGDIDLSILRGRVSIKGLSIEQPPGFVRDGQVVFLDVPFASVDVNLRSLFEGKLLVQEIAARDIEVRIVKNAEGEMNVASLVAASEQAAEPAITEETNRVAEAEAPAGMPVIINRLVVENVSVFYLDESMGEDPLRADIIDLNIHGRWLIVDMAGTLTDADPGELTVTARIVQEQGDALLGLCAEAMPFTAAGGTLNAAMRLVGVELKAFAAAVPPGVATTLGGDCIDVHVDASVHPGLLDVELLLTTSDNQMKARIEGTPDKPKVDKSAALFAVFGRFGGGLGNVAMSAGEAGVQVADTAVDTVAAAGKGAAKTVGNVGKGLFRTIKGVASADLKEAGRGIKDTTVGTLGEAVGTVADTTGALVDGVGDTASAAVGAGDANKWRAAKQSRYEALWAAARTHVADTPLPATREQSVATMSVRDLDEPEAPAEPVVSAPDEPTKGAQEQPAVEAKEEPAGDGDAPKHSDPGAENAETPSAPVPDAPAPEADEAAPEAPDAG